MLTSTPPAASLARGVGLIAATAIGVVLELVHGDLFTSTPPHPTLLPTVGAISSICVTNLRIVAVPFILIAFRFPSAASTRTAGDLVLTGILFANAVRIGLAIGRWQTQLVPYLPNTSRSSTSRSPSPPAHG